MASSFGYRLRTPQNWLEYSHQLVEKEILMGGSTSDSTPTTTYTQSDWEQGVQDTVTPWINYIYNTDRYNSGTQLWDTPYLSDYVQSASNYAPSSASYQDYYNVLAPSLTSTYEKTVEKPLISKLVNAGTFGSNYGGVSGAAANALQEGREDLASTINTQILEAYEPYGTNQQTSMYDALKQWYQAYLEQQQYPFQAVQTVGFESDEQPIVTT
jgi:hypothetical protein